MPETDNSALWQPQDAAASRDFFTTPHGQKLKSLLYQAIEFKEAVSLEEEALNFRSYKGGKAVLEMLETCIAFQPQPEPDNVVQFYPPPTN